MKKVISLALAALMLICALPVCAFAAAPVDYTANGEFLFSDSLNATVKEGVTMTIPDGVDMTVNSGETFTIEKGATLIVLGTLEVCKGAVMEIKGTLAYPERITVLGTANVYFTFANTGATLLGSHLSSVFAGYSKSGSVYADVADADSDAVCWSENLISGGTFAAPLNSYVYIKPSFRQPNVAGYADASAMPKTYDSEKLKVYRDGMLTECKQGVRIIKADTASAITYSDWTDSAYLYDYKFLVPTGSGYTVHGANGENSAYGAILIPAGTDFRFRVEIDKEYDQAVYSVYVYEGYTYDNETGEDKVANGDAILLTAEDGFYTIPAVYSDYSIYVAGVVSNDTIKTASSVLDLLRNFINTIKAFFENLGRLLGIDLGA